MAVIENRAPSRRPRGSERWDDIRRAFVEFLWVPTCIIIALLLLALAARALDHAAWDKSTSARAFRTYLESHVFADAQATSDLLGVIAGGVITMTSLTITVLLIVVQQTAASMTSEVLDQFLRRRHNQVYFGFFVGLALYALMILATVNAPFNPVFGASLAVLLTVIALYLLLALVYTTINQMRPAVIVEAIHDHILSARCAQRSLLDATRRAPRGCAADAVTVAVELEQHGFVTRINLAPLESALDAAEGKAEIVLDVSIGSHVAYGDKVASVCARTREVARSISSAVAGALHLEHQRDVQADPAYGIEQLEMIAWTSISTSKSDPAPGILVIRSLRDVLARWTADTAACDGAALPIVYRDNVPGRLMDAFETLAVVSSESMQHQSFAEVVHALAVMFHRLSPAQQARAEDLVRRILTALGDHVLTCELDRALSKLVEALAACSRSTTASAVRAAQTALRGSIGQLRSRATRAARS